MNKRRIIISESQYKRVFLNEQLWNPHILAWTHPAYSNYPDVPKDMIYKKNPDGTFSKKYHTTSNRFDGYVDDDVSIDDPDVVKKRIVIKNENEFKNRIKTKEDGDKFREWVRSDKNRLSKVKTELNKNGLTGTLDATGSHTNDYIKLAWNLVGNEYIMSSYDTKWYNKYINVESGLVPEFDWFGGEDLKKHSSYISYLEALKNWDKVRGELGWSGPKSMSSEQIDKLLKDEFLPNVCIDPTYILEQINMRYGKMQLEAGDKFNTVLWSNFDEYFGELSPKEQEYMKIQNQGGKEFIWKDGKYIEKKTESPATNFFWDSLPDDHPLKPNDEKIKLLRKNPLESIRDKRFGYFPEISDSEHHEMWEKYLYIEKLNNELKGISDDSKTKVKSQFTIINKYQYILDNIIEKQNTIIRLQSLDKMKNTCGGSWWDDDNDIMVTLKKTTYVTTTYTFTGGVVSTDEHKFSLKQACKNNGGLFLYPLNPMEKNKGVKSWGFIGDKAMCCCVKSDGTATVDVVVIGMGKKGEPRKYKQQIKVSDYCEKYTGDVRSFWEKTNDYTVNCMNDWHCLADIASIAALAFGPAGILLSGLIDLISAIGYVIEADEGWQLNAGLTMVGAAFGIGEFVKLAGKGTKFASKLNDLGKILEAGKGGDILKLESDIAQWSKSLSKNELKYYDELVAGLRNFESTGVNNIEAWVVMINKQAKDLTKTEKGILANMFKNNDPETVMKLYADAGDDLAAMIAKYHKGIKQVAIQGGLFVTLHYNQEWLGDKIHKLCKNYGVDLFGIFDDKCEPLKQGNIRKVPEINWTELQLRDPQYVENLKTKLEQFNVKVKTEELERIEKNIVKAEDNLIEVNKHIPNIGSNNEDNINKAKEKLNELYAIFQSSVEGDGIDESVINSKIDVVNEVCNEILSLDNLSGIISIIDRGITKLNSIKNPKLSEEHANAILETGNPYITDEGIDIWEGILDELYEIEKKENEDMEKSEKLNEEIDRIKSLFGNNRLYGNMINEACDNEEEAIKFLQDRGYMVDESKNSECVGPNTSLKYVKQVALSETNVGHNLKSDTPAGCMIKIYSRSPTMPIQRINFFEGPTGKRVAIFLLADDSSFCDLDLHNIFPLIPQNAGKFNGGIEGFDQNTSKFGIGIKYAQLDGFWDYDSNGGKITIKNLVLVRLLNKNFKGVPTRGKFTIGSVTVDDEIPDMDDRTMIGQKQFMDDGSGACTTIDSWINTQLDGPISGNFNLQTIIENRM